MRINRFLAQATSLSRRAADIAIANGRVRINGQPASLGSQVTISDTVTLDGAKLTVRQNLQTLLLNKPVGYVCSRAGQGSKTIYELLPPELHHLKPVGRLDKDSSGLLILTDDGDLAHQLTHPSFEKPKVYHVTLDSDLSTSDHQRITKQGVKLDDGLSKFELEHLSVAGFMWHVTIREGRNRQIRRTFEKLGYKVVELHRIQFGTYKLGHLLPGEYKQPD